MEIRKFIKNEDGNVGALLAFGMVAIIGMAALSLDVGAMYLHKNRLVNATDAAVLAGAHELVLNPANATAVAEQYAQVNGIDAGDISFQVSEDNKSITGIANEQMSLFFAPVLGINSQTIHANAKAQLSVVGAYTGIVPFGVEEREMDYGDTVILKNGAGEGQTYGWFGALRIDGNGADNYRDNIKYGCDIKVQVGDSIPVEPGNMSGPTSEGVSYRINQCSHSPKCTIDHYVEGCPRIVVVPIGYNNGAHGSNARFIVTSFAAFLISDVPGNGTNNDVEGAFIRYVAPAQYTDAGASGADTGLYSASLIQ